MKPSLALIGCGKMGQALLTGWLKRSLNYNITVVQPDPLPQSFPQDGYIFLETLPANISFDIIVFAVKPQVINEVIQGYLKSVHEATLIISIAAGKNISTFENVFGEKQPIIRTMPNTPAAIGKGITALCSNSSVLSSQKKQAEDLFSACGQTIWLETEDQMDAVTAISGSGPAYLFYFIEAFAKAAEDAGLPPQTALRLARQTITGAAALAENELDIPVSILRKNVTSPGGTTEAGLKIFMDGALDNILHSVITAAKERSKELNK